MKRWGLSLALVAFGLSGAAHAEQQGDYCYPNPTVSSGVKPTILILLDDSGSMAELAYNTSSASYDSSERYYGYAVQEWWYTESGGSYEPSHECTTACSTGDIPQLDSTGTYVSGNYINFAEMQRVDVARKAIMGGKTSPRISNKKPSASINNFLTEDGNKIYPVTSLRSQTHPSGVIQDYYNNARWAVSWFDSSGNGSQVVEYVYDIQTNETNLYTAVENLSPGGETPLAEALWSATGLFAQIQTPSDMPDAGSLSIGSDQGPLYNNSDYQLGSEYDPMNYAEKANQDTEFPQCQNAFVLMITDGIPTGDESTPSGFDTYVTNSATGQDTQFTFDGKSSPGTGEISLEDDELENVAFYGRVNDFGTDLPADRGTGVLPGKQNILLYPMYVFGNQADAEEILKKAAVNGGFKDTDDDGVPYYDATDCTIASTATADYNSGSKCQNEWDFDLDGIPDNYFQAEDGNLVEDKLRAAISQILKRVSSGSTVATISSQTRSGGALIQAYYRPLETPGGIPLDWKGYVRGIWTDPKGNLREDAPGDGLLTDNFDGTYDDHELKLAEDRILRFRFDAAAKDTEDQVKGDLYLDSDGDNVPDTCTASSTVNNTEVEPLWEAGRLLTSRDPANRTIWFNNNGTKTNLTTSVAPTVSPYWEGAVNDPQELIKFIRGYDNPNGNTQYRLRQTASPNTEAWDGTWKLGPVITSTPRVIRQNRASGWVDPEGTYYNYYTSDTVTKRPSMVLVGGNDGMLHAFYAGEISPNSTDSAVSADLKSCSAASGISCSGSNVTPGTEAWSFIPQNALPYLRWYGEMTADCLVPTVDYRVQVIDAAVGQPPASNDVSADTQSAADWRTLAVGMMGFGGQSISCDWDEDGTTETLSSSIFVLDITDPESPTLLWEKALPDHSLAMSYPSVVRRVSSASNNHLNGDWYLVFGSGPTEPEGKNFVDEPKLWVWNLKDGASVETFNLNAQFGISDMAVGETVPADPDRDDIGDAVYFGTYGGPEADEGSLYRLNFAASQTDWSINEVAHFSSSLGGRPFFAAPGLAKDPQEDLWVYGGTGRFLASEDKTLTTTPQFLFGMRDDCWGDGIDATGSAGESANPGGSDCTGSSFSYPMEVDTELVRTDGVTVTADEITQECRCGGVNYPEDTESDCTNDGADWVVTLTGDITYNSCPSGVDCSSPDRLRDSIKAEGGWYRQLDTTDSGERIFSQPFINAGLVNALGFVPETNKCEPGGTTNQFALDYRTGTPPAHVVFLNSSGYDVSSKEIKGHIEVGKGVPPLGEAFAAMPGSEEGETNTLTQTSTGEIVKNPTKTPTGQKGIIYRSEPD